MRLNKMMFLSEDTGGGDGGGNAAEGAATGESSVTVKESLLDSQGQQSAPRWNWTKEDGSFTDGWADKLPEDLKSQADRLAKFNSVPALMKSYVNLESKLGLKQGAILPPSEKSTPEEISAFRKALGVPDAPESYKILPETMPEGWEIPKDTLDAVAKVAHKHNISEAGIRELMALQIANREQEEKSFAQAQAQRLEDSKKILQDEWKGNYERNIKLATMAAKSVGADVASVGFSDPEVVKALVRLGEKMGDDKLINGNTAPSMQPGKSRANEIMTNPKDSLYDDYHGKNGAIRQRDAAKLVTDLLRNG